MCGRVLPWRMQVDVLSPLKKEEKAALAKCLTESCHEASLDLLVMFTDVFCTASQCRLSGSYFSLLRTSSFPLVMFFTSED
jgi:hypothetical protein